MPRITCYDKGMKNKILMEDFMWVNHFKLLYEKLPDNRKTEVIEVLRNIIVDMHNAGYAAASIGRYLDKDHTTVLHHLKTMNERSEPHRLTVEDVQNRKRMMEERAHDRLAKLKARNDALEAKKNLREKLTEEHLRAKELKSQKYWDVRKDADIMREKVFAMYKDGASYHAMSMKYKIGPSRIQGLLIQHPEYQKIKPKRSIKNTIRPVLKYSLDGKTLLAEYPTGRAAGRMMNMASVAISMCAQGKIPTAGGFIWKFKETV